MATLLVRVETDGGVSGCGEAFGFNLAETTRHALDTMVAPLCVGQDPRDMPALTLLLHRRLHNFGRNGPVTFALAGLDIALWDIAGKLAGQPLYRLLGATETVREVPAYASLLRYGEPERVARNAAEAVGRGFRHLKLHEVDPACIRAAREAAPGIAPMIDMNCPFDAEAAIAWAAEIAAVSPRWIEEPVWPPEDFRGARRGPPALRPAGRGRRERRDRRRLPRHGRGRGGGRDAAERHQDRPHARARGRPAGAGARRRDWCRTRPTTAPACSPRRT